MTYNEIHVGEFIQKAAKDLMNPSYVVCLTGAGISTESGIPDFRGPYGISTKDPEAEMRAFDAPSILRIATKFSLI